MDGKHERSSHSSKYYITILAYVNQLWKEKIVSECLVVFHDGAPQLRWTLYHVSPLGFSVNGHFHTEKGIKSTFYSLAM